jgi:hypothetical protein
VSQAVPQLPLVLREGYGDREVLFAYQRHYPLQDHIAGGWIPGPADDEDADDDATDDEVVYLVSGGQVYDQPYGPRRAFEEAVESL